MRNPQAIQSCLGNCGTAVIRSAPVGRNGAVKYGQGIIVGVCSTLMAQGMELRDAIDSVQRYVWIGSHQVTGVFSHDCVPTSWRPLWNDVAMQHGRSDLEIRTNAKGETTRTVGKAG